MKTLLVDANIIIRFLLGDHRTLSQQATTLFSQSQAGKYLLYIDEVVIAEVVWVLSSFYQVSRVDIVSKLEHLMSQEWVENPKKSIALHALSLYKKTAFDYIDCWLLALAKKYDVSLETFDRKLKRANKKQSL